MTQPPVVSVIVPNYNGISVLGNALDSLLSLVTEPSAEIIVVDNASSDGSRQMVAQKYRSVQLVGRGVNEGFARACNAGARVAHGNYLLFLNSDIMFRENPLPRMLDYLRSNPDVGIVACQLVDPDGTQQPSAYKFPGLLWRFLQLSGLKQILVPLRRSQRSKTGKFVTVDFVAGACLLIPANLFAAIGGFDERYFMYTEDADLCYTAKTKQRATVLYMTQNVVHLGRNYERWDNPFLLRNANRGQIIFYAKHRSVVALVLLSVMSIPMFLIRFWIMRMAGKRLASDALREVVRMYAKVIAEIAAGRPVLPLFERPLSADKPFVGDVVR